MTDNDEKERLKAEIERLREGLIMITCESINAEYMAQNILDGLPPNATETHGAAAKKLADEVERQKELVNDLSGVLWRLEKYGFIDREVDDSERGQCDHFREIGRQAVERARANPDCVLEVVKDSLTGEEG